MYFSRFSARGNRPQSTTQTQTPSFGCGGLADTPEYETMVSSAVAEFEVEAALAAVTRGTSGGGGGGNKPTCEDLSHLLSSRRIGIPFRHGPRRESEEARVRRIVASTTAITELMRRIEKERWNKSIDNFTA
jgi:hypothetical protein